MMRKIRRSSTLLILLGLVLTVVGPVRAADTTASPSVSSPQTAETAGEKTPDTNVGNAPTAQSPPGEKTAPREEKIPRTRKPFRPSEEIHVDKAVDFPADI